MPVRLNKDAFWNLVRIFLAILRRDAGAVRFALANCHELAQHVVVKSVGAVACPRQVWMLAKRRLAVLPAKAQRGLLKHNLFETVAAVDGFVPVEIGLALCRKPGLQRRHARVDSECAGGDG
jgi:hypothetical protein